jgi:hypothetical protein
LLGPPVACCVEASLYPYLSVGPRSGLKHHLDWPPALPFEGPLLSDAPRPLGAGGSCVREQARETDSKGPYRHPRKLVCKVYWLALVS